ncbi:FG-GAP-like repeat-containing protein [Portibacter marinus]|uniref:FG-GAP-like repeat-containing protein n=1 Tax=Portibacter marinus TaxID=2898660 RepID=UPI001F428323|nr:FG-GAP-like repeat-containing protein [Portibacter marinus]
MKVFVLILASFVSASAQQFVEHARKLNIGHITYSPNMMAGGVSIFDFNNDHLQDIYFIGGAYPDHLYLNLGDGFFKDISQEAGISQISDRYTMGVTAGDLDNDGFTDLYITTFNGDRDICLRNLGGIEFADVADQAGFFGENWSMGATFADIDEDGDLDIYVSNFLNFEGEPFFNSIQGGQRNFFYENLGNWKFVGNMQRFSSDSKSCSLVSCFTDINNDREPDLFVINDFGYKHGPNELFLNEGGQFRDIGEEMRANAAMDGMGIAIGDFDEDGFFDYYLSNVGDNIFYQNNGGLHFTDISNQFNVNDGKGYGWGSFFADLNNDSYLDLFVGKGSISESYDPQENKLYEYYPYFSDFADVSHLKGLSDAGKARGVAYGDLNNDGQLDIVLNCVRTTEDNEDLPLIYLNDNKSGSFVNLLLEGVESTRQASGARVELFTGDRKLIREVTTGSSYLSSHDQRIHFGLADHPLDSLKVHWPRGSVQTFHNLEINKFYHVVEGNAPVVLFEETISSATALDPNASQIKVSPNPAFDHTTISFDELASAQITLYNSIGEKQPLTYQLKDQNTAGIRTDHLGAGAYFIEIKTKDVAQIIKLVVNSRI